MFAEFGKIIILEADLIRIGVDDIVENDEAHIFKFKNYQ